MNAAKIYCHAAAIHEVKKVQNLRRSALKKSKNITIIAAISYNIGYICH